MQNRYMMTAFGRDRVGIVADVTSLLYEFDCNLEDTTMNMLSDEFTLNLLFSSNRDNIEEVLLRECRRLELEKGVSAFIRPLDNEPQEETNSYKNCTLHIECLDQVGIVYKTSRFLAEKKLNIVHLNSTSKPSPESGAALHLMEIQIQVPEEVSMEQLEDGLGTMADELQVDIHISH